MHAAHPLAPEAAARLESEIAGVPEARTGRGITGRSVTIGLILMALNAYWITVVEVRWYTLDGTSLPLFITPVFFLFALCGMNAGVRRFRPGWALAQGEMLAVYIMLVIGSALASHDLLQNLFGHIAHP